jgi:hypothetical protein
MQRVLSRLVFNIIGHSKNIKAGFIDWVKTQKTQQKAAGNQSVARLTTGKIPTVLTSLTKKTLFQACTFYASLPCARAILAQKHSRVIKARATSVFS